MDVNATLIFQMVVFAIFVWITMRYIWPPITKAMEERRAKIADGLAAAEKGQHDLDAAKHQIKVLLDDAKAQAAHIIEQGHQRAQHLVEEAQLHAREESDRLLQLAHNEIAQEYQMAKDALLKEVSILAVAGAEKILGKAIDKASNDKLVANLMDEI